MKMFAKAFPPGTGRSVLFTPVIWLIHDGDILLFCWLMPFNLISVRQSAFDWWSFVAEKAGKSIKMSCESICNGARSFCIRSSFINLRGTLKLMNSLATSVLRQIRILSLKGGCSWNNQFFSFTLQFLIFIFSLSKALWHINIIFIFSRFMI